MAKEQQLSPAREQEWFVICAQGDGPGTWVVPAEKLHETMHAQYCTCSKKWQDCTTEGVRQMVADLDDDDHWSHEYPDYARHVFTDHGEDYTLTVIRIQPSELDAYSAPLRQVPKFRFRNCLK
jgi:hypothetical protein